MSSILKALQKLEQEKAIHRQGAPDVAADIVKPAAARQRSPWLIPAAMAGMTILAVIVTYALMGGFSRHPPVPAAAVPQAVAPLEKIATTKPSADLPVTALVPPPRPIPDSRKSPAQPAPELPAGTAVPQQAPPRKPALPLPQPQNQPAPPLQAKGEPVTPPATAKLPALKVTGIAWQKDNASRLAMINGAAVLEGGMVEGARVDEIFPDRVRFTVGTRTIEIPLGKSSDDR
ncbi:MAG: hypothetical protein CXR31_09820 [Geobacter sp.]|nr:MAG: hypothetical protein CXR31_09820 [Geobacter sp.]